MRELAKVAIAAIERFEERIDCTCDEYDYEDENCWYHLTDAQQMERRIAYVALALELSVPV